MDLYSTGVLTGVVNSLTMAPSWLLDTFFTGVQTAQTEEIHFDVEPDVLGLAPFVSPVVGGQVMTDQGFTTRSFKPAYIKPKHPLSPTAVLKRTIGEPLMGTLSPMDRQMIRLNNLLRHQRGMIDRRLEWMAASALRTGAVVISGNQYQTRNVDFARAGALTIALSGGARWGQAGVKPLDMLTDWNTLMYKTCGSAGPNIVMTADVWKVFRVDPDVKDRLRDQRTLLQLPSLNQGAVFQTGGQFMGTMDGFNIWVYQGWYKNDSGVVTPFLPDGTVLMIGDLMGYRAFGAILDEEALFADLPYFSKSWVEKDPSQRLVMTQSAPLVVPYRVNATLCATVL